MTEETMTRISAEFKADLRGVSKEVKRNNALIIKIMLALTAIVGGTSLFGPLF